MPFLNKEKLSGKKPWCSSSDSFFLCGQRVPIQTQAASTMSIAIASKIQAM